MIRTIKNIEKYSWGDNCTGWHLLKSDTLSVIQEQMPPNTSEILHFHRHAQQVFYVLSGTATFRVSGKEHIVTGNESIGIPKRTLHKISNKEGENLTFLVISEPKTDKDRIEIIEYTDALKDAIKILNYEWLERYFKIEQGDLVTLSNPEEEIIHKGGYIFYARMNNLIVGTVSLLKKSDTILELGKMAVSFDAQGLGIGTQLLEHCFNMSKRLSIQKLILYSNTRLESSMHLYRKYGFYEVLLEKGHYERADIKMECQLSSPNGII